MRASALSLVVALSGCHGATKGGAKTDFGAPQDGGVSDDLAGTSPRSPRRAEAPQGCSAE
jgi:hypothetical protein